MLIIQNSTAPANIRHAIVDLVERDTAELRVASAYVTRGGSNILLETMTSSLGEQVFAAIPKVLATSFDFGLTEPLALRDWLNLDNVRVLVAGSQLVERRSLIPLRAFHPKMYAFGKGDSTFSMLVGSANLTGRGLSVNAEAAWAQQHVPMEQVNSAFERTLHETVELSDELLAAYDELRQRHPPPAAVGTEASPVPAPAAIIVDQLPLFRTSIETGAVDPAGFGAMWIQGEGLQGGSRSQLELPRGGHKFFGFHFDRYNYPHNLIIGRPVLRSGLNVWNNRPLTWHGNNRMERMNLPTVTQGGFNYADSAVLFRRLPDNSFELIVAPWDSDLSRAWRQASSQKQLLFRLGAVATNRVVGLI